MKLAVVSNFDTRLRPLLKAMQLDTLFDAIIVSAVRLTGWSCFRLRALVGCPLKRSLGQQTVLCLICNVNLFPTPCRRWVRKSPTL